MEDLKYPIGIYTIPEKLSDREYTDAMTKLEEFPSKLRTLVSNMSDLQLETPYRPDGWTVRQLIHHIADSHHHSYIRFKWALTEDNPIIKPYEEQAWAVLPDVDQMPIEWSLKHIEVIHYKLTRLLKALSVEQSLSTFIHPASGNTINLRQNASMYAWHSEHHFAHITNLVKREGW